MFAAQAAISSPKLHVTLRRAYGFGGALMALQPFDAQTVALALPGARLGPVPGGGDPGDSAALLEHGELGGAYAAADTMRYDEVVEPAELRDALLAALRLTAARRRSQPQPVVRRGIRP
jgi:acetyl-CoA carboxylase carboxyltransferase component